MSTIGTNPSGALLVEKSVASAGFESFLSRVLLLRPRCHCRMHILGVPDLGVPAISERNGGGRNGNNDIERMKTSIDIPVPVSFGLDVTKPWKLQTRTTGEVLADIRDGKWREAILIIRAMIPDSEEQDEAKKKLPYVTWAGTFKYRDKERLKQHSGQIGIDLDHLSSAECTKAKQDAAADSYCLAAFLSVRANGVRLLFRIPPCDAKSHEDAFNQIAEHVRKTYGHEPDPSGSDVCRASFISFDEDLWFNPKAEVFPVVLDMTHSDFSPFYRCVSTPLYAGELAVIAWAHMGRAHLGFITKADGTVQTHKPLLDLGLRMALHAERFNYTLTPRDYDEAIRTWYSEHQKQGLKLRGDIDEYRLELMLNAKAARNKPWFNDAAYKWLRWTKLPDFPAKAEDRLMFAIRHHCEVERKNKFFIGVRDAGLACGASYKTGHRYLQILQEKKKIRLLTLPEDRKPHEAFEYEIIEDCAPQSRPEYPQSEVGDDFSQN